MLAVGAAGDMADPWAKRVAPRWRKSLRNGKKSDQEKSEGKKKCEKQPYRWEEEEEEMLQVAKQIIPRGVCLPLEVIMVE